MRDVGGGAPGIDANVSRHLRAAAARHPGRAAVIVKSGERLSFAQLDAECNRFAAHFEAKGIRRGMRVAVFVRPGFAFVPTIYGLFRLGAVPVCIDPGMKLGNLLACVREAAPEGMVGIPIALAIARLFPGAFRTVKRRVRVPRIVPGNVEHARFDDAPTASDDTAAVLFTSGSTGVPKGVVYTHAAFDAQQRLLRETYGIGDAEVDLVVFPLFALFTAAWGITAVIPGMNPARPARAKGKALAALIEAHGVTHASGSPAVFRNLATYCESTGTRFPRLRRVLMAGAQVPEKLVRAVSRIAGTVHTPYGATEALPLTTISQAELFATYDKTRVGAGTCVGKPLPGVDIAILPFIDGCVTAWSESLRLPAFSRGEIAVRAPWVTREYFGKPQATRQAKIYSSQGVWHRMGDVGYLDDCGRLWFCGRKDHRILAAGGTTIYPDPIEAIFDSHPAVGRSAVVGVGPPGAQRPVLVVEGKRSRMLEEELEAHAKRYHVAELAAIRFRKAFPVDVRHNIKIDRPMLARWIEKEAR